MAHDELAGSAPSAKVAVSGEAEAVVKAAPIREVSSSQRAMDAFSSSPVLEHLEKELGRVTWMPSYDLVRRVERARRRKAGRGLGLGFIAVAFAGGAALTFSPDSFAISASLSSVAALLFLGSLWLMRDARNAPPFPFAVFEDGIFVPGTFENALDVQKFGPARAIRRSKIKAVEDMRRKGERAIIVWTRAGYGGVVTGRIGEVELSRDEQDAALDGFLEALKAIGVEPVAKETSA